MKQSRKLIVAFVLVLIVLFSFSSFSFAKPYDLQAQYQVDKMWKIGFNMPIDPSSLTADSVYVLDGKSKHVTTLQLIDNGYTIQVSPAKNYEKGKSYRLVITSLVQSRSGKALKTPIEFPFYIEDPNAKIQSISTVSGDIVSNVTVKTSSDVYKVKIGINELHYEGNNTFSYGLIDVKAGTVITVYAYDENNRLVETKKYTVWP